MDKISGIIPQTPRTGSKRGTDNTPVRPGAPQFGRPVGSSEIKDRVSITNAQSTQLKPYKNPRDAAHVKIAESMTRKFFLTPEKEIATGASANEVATLVLPESDLSFTEPPVNILNDNNDNIE
jgi:hypothetical protein